MSKEKTGYGIIADLIEIYGESFDLSKIDREIPQFIEKRLGTRSQVDCKVMYSEKHTEMRIWALGLICQEYILEMFKKKAANGHCYTHKKVTGKPCSEGSKFHEDLLQSCKKSFEDVLKKY
jgi:hypothetical protein